MKPILVGIGEILWDIFPSQDESVNKTFGGATTNFAYHAHALGAQGIPVSCIGSDTLGDDIMVHLQTLALTDDYIFRSPGYPTGTVTVTTDTDGNPTYTIQEQVAWDTIPFYPKLMELAESCDAICFGTLAQRSEASRETIQEFLHATRSDTLRIFDINLRQSFYSIKIIKQSLQAANILKMNSDELATISSLLSLTGNEKEIADQLLKHYSLHIVALTKGCDGSILYSPENRSVHNGLKSTVYDTVGAGDAFTAALALGIIHGYDLERINEYANRVASFVCSCPGATPEIPEELQLRKNDYLGKAENEMQK